MFHSAEARWFLPGRVDADVDAWIRSGGLGSDQGERTDAYIVLPGCRTAGVKFRDANFEVKAATSASRDFAIGETVAGRRETWVKWSRPLGDHLAGAMRADERWAFVRKHRVVRLFSLESGVVADASYDGPRLAAGCQVERTLVSAMLRSASQGPPQEGDWQSCDAWWTFGFETFGEPGRLDDYLDRMLDHFVADAADISLPREASLSYPAWLAELAAA